MDTPRHHKLFYGSSYDRGLDMLLPIWPAIKEKFPDATLDIAYGWDLFDKGYADNPERRQWKERINKQMEQPGITHHGRISQDKLKELRQQCGIWVYPTYFPEINCITALECQKDGVVPCVINFAALKETVQSGVKVDGDIYDDETKAAFLSSLLELMGDPKKWQEEQRKGMEFAKQFDWSQIASKWKEVFEDATKEKLPTQASEKVQV